MHDARVSVIIPCFNQAQFLSDAIDSALEQTHRDVEIIVVDDGSTDGTAHVVSRYPAVRYLHRRNGGLSAARNTGLEASGGAFLIFLDADDRLLPDAAEQGLACFDRHPSAAFVYGHFRYIRGDGSLLSQPLSPPAPADFYAAMLERNFIAMHATVMYRRTIFGLVGSFDPALRACEDYDLYLRIARRFPLASHGNVVAEYRQHGASMSRNSARMLRSSIEVLNRQRHYAAQRSDLQAAFARGMNYWQTYYGDLLVSDLLEQMHSIPEWRRFPRNLGTLCRYDRPGVAKLSQEILRRGRKRLRRRR